VGMFGLVSNGAAILAVRYNPALWNSFGLLCLSRSIANVGALCIFVFWITPITLFDVPLRNIRVEQQRRQTTKQTRTTVEHRLGSMDSEEHETRRNVLQQLPALT
ncbi:hypothetical protein KIN20_002028, partial [Parelaphostrongylus tenuis]